MTSYAPHQTPLINQIPPPKRRLSENLPPFLGNYVPTFSASDVRRANTQTGSDWEWYYAYSKSRCHTLHHALSQLRPQDLFDLRIALGLLWALVLWWGEHSAFASSINSCDWRYWEAWPGAANPHRVVLVADPQLVDPHTYPGRPWPLSWATVYYTDAYLRKSFTGIVGGLRPDSVFFLGDLMDGGREWSPPGNEGGGEKRWKKYGQRQWFREYERFGRVFVDPWVKAGRGRREEEGRGRKMVVGLPGNHDLGLGNGIRLPVRERFYAYFGGGNRIDLVGNHTFVSVDTVSLSAKGQPDTGAGISDTEGNEIWQPTEQFLHEAIAIKGRLVNRHLRSRKNDPENPPMDHEILDVSDPRTHTSISLTPSDTDIPSILLSHVPLFRTENTPCGPLRERWPSNPSSPEEKDPRNAIPMQYGKQYQNVLTAAVSSEIIDLVGDFTHAFSGDDHDYCEVVHREYTAKGGGIKEITVKSLSWAMGVRRPGFLLVSLWNPVDKMGKALGKGATVQTKLCLLPDQLGVFMHYAWLLVFTALVLVGGATKTVLRGQVGRDEGVLNGSLLPLASPSRTKPKPEELDRHSASSSTSDHGMSIGLSARATKTRTGYGYEPPSPVSADMGGAKAWQEIDLNGRGSKTSVVEGLRAIWRETRRGLKMVALPVGLWYFWLLWHS